MSRFMRSIKAMAGLLAAVREVIVMKSAFLTAIFLCLSQPVMACNYDLIRVIEWKITPENSDVNVLETSFRYEGDRAIRMIDASVRVGDVLGGSIGVFVLTRDVDLEPGHEISEKGRWGQFTFERLLDMEANDVKFDVCVSGVVYADGSVEQF